MLGGAQCLGAGGDPPCSVGGENDNLRLPIVYRFDLFPDKIVDTPRLAEWARD